MARLAVDRHSGSAPDRLLLLEHASVYTHGRRWRPEHLLVSEEDLTRHGIERVESDRGGDITWHGPGQLVGYPIVALEGDRRDLHRYLRDLERVLIGVCDRLGVRAFRRAGLTGAWTDRGKIAAIGVRVSRWVTMHGFALNWRCNLAAFDAIVPCGLAGEPVTSLAAQGVCIEREALVAHVVEEWAQVFGPVAIVTTDLAP